MAHFHGIFAYATSYASNNVLFLNWAKKYFTFCPCLLKISTTMYSDGKHINFFSSHLFKNINIIIFYNIIIFTLRTKLLKTITVAFGTLFKFYFTANFGDAVKHIGKGTSNTNQYNYLYRIVFDCICDTEWKKKWLLSRSVINFVSHCTCIREINSQLKFV